MRSHFSSRSWRALGFPVVTINAARHLATPPPPGGVRPPPRTPPPPPGMRKGPPPPPPLPSKGGSGSGAPGGAPTGGALLWKSPAEVLALMIQYIPTFYVPVNCVGAVMDEEHRAMFVGGKGKFTTFLKKYRFYFDVRLVDGARYDVRLREDLQHPRKGAADEKYELTDVGDVATYTAKAEFVQSWDSLERPQNSSVSVRPVTPPPSVRVVLEEKVAVVERLRALVPAEFTDLVAVEDEIPEDVLFHPYFDCQGGLLSIAGKLPEHFQVVNGQIRLRRRHLAPLATDEFGFDDSPEPDIIANVKERVEEAGVTQWLGVTSMYETLTMEQRRRVKRGYKSFAGFLRAHGKSLSISHDTLKVSMWVPPREVAAAAKESDVDKEDAGKPAEQDAPATNSESKPEQVGVVKYTMTHIVNMLFDRIPPHRSVTGTELMELLEPAVQECVPNNVVGFLQNHPQYFIVDVADPDLAKVQVRRASSAVPLDLCRALYTHIPEEGGIAVVALLERLPPKTAEVVRGMGGLRAVTEALSEWLEVLDGDIFRRRPMDELEKSIAASSAKRRQPQDRDGGKAFDPETMTPQEAVAEALKYDGSMATSVPRHGGGRRGGGPRFQ